MLIIGITGGVGAGKTRILEYLKSHCVCRVILADEVANEIKEPGQSCYDKLVELLGKQVLEEDGRINRGKMAELIFAHQEYRKQVNAIIHPGVKEYILETIRKERQKGELDCIFLEAALLIECGYSTIVDELWYIYSSKEVRKQRLKESRQYSEEKIRQIMASQLSEEQFRQAAQVVIDNSGAFSAACSQLEEQCRRLQIWKED